MNDMQSHPTFRCFTWLVWAGFLSSLGLHAQTANTWRYRQRVAPKTESPIEIIGKKYDAKLDTLVASFRHWKYTASDTLGNPYYSALMGSPTLYGATLNRVIGKLGSGDLTPGDASSIYSSQHAYDVQRATDYYLTAAYTQIPWVVQHQEVKEGTLNVDSQIRKGVKTETTLTERLITETSTKEPAQVMHYEDDLNIIVRKPNFWTFKTNFSLQFTQNYVSDNWYKGGESHNALLAATQIEANYNNQQKLTFDNKLEMKLGFQSSHNDDEHKYKTNSDLLRLTNKLGLRATKHWYYTVMLQSWTQFYRGYKANDPVIYSDFMSPFESVLSVGMDYQMKTKNERFNVTATLSPMALKMTYVGRPSLVASFGISEGKHSKWEVGSNITVNYTWNIVKNVSWAGRIYFFTDYSKSQIEWENTFNLTINKYLSARLFLYPRFDDSLQRKEGDSYFQFNELLSLGLNVNF